MLLDSIETIRKVLASASRAKLPYAEKAMDELSVINAAMIELNGMRAEVIQAAIAEQEAEDACNGSYLGTR